MARRVRDANLETRAARSKLKASGKPYYKAIGRGIHVGYRKGKNAGRWVARFYAGNQTYRTETIAHADDVVDADGKRVLDFWQAQEIARARHSQLYTDNGQIPGHITVGSAVSEYLDWMDVHRKSAADARSRSELWILPELGDIEIVDLTADRLRAWLRRMSEAPPRSRRKDDDKQNTYSRDNESDTLRRRRASANRVLTILKAALNNAFREGKTSSDREWRRVKPFANVEKARVRYLTVAEARELLSVATGQFRYLLAAALQTGARYGELASLRVSDFNPDAGTILVRESKGGRPRHIVLTDEGRELFRGLCAKRGAEDFLFTTENGGPWKKSSQIRPMAQACSQAGIEPPIGFHGLRHTWASLSAMNGVPLMVIAKNLGHSDTRMVEKHYGHLSDSYVADAIRAGAPKFGIEV